MAAVSKNDSGVVELRTDVGRLYVRPTSWQRLYLQWTFRNFHILPQQVLNRRQQRLIDKLWRTAIVTPSETVPPGGVIGVVENMRVLALPSAAAADGAKTAKPAVVDATRLATVRGSAEEQCVEAGSPDERMLARVEAAASPEIAESGPVLAPTSGAERAGTPEPVVTVTYRSGTKRILQMLEFAGAVVVLVAAFQLAPLWRAQQLELSTPLAPQVPPAMRAELETRAAVVTAGSIQGDVARGSAASEPLIAFKSSLGLAQRTRRSAAPPAQAPGANLGSLPQIAEAPRAGFIYPVAPNPNLVGKVVLKAVVASDGTVKQVEVLSGDRALALAAARAVRHWRYAPAEVQGHAVEAQTQVTVSFLGDDAVSIILPRNQ